MKKLNIKSKKTTVEYINPLGMTITVSKRFSERELSALQNRSDVKVIRK